MDSLCVIGRKRQLVVCIRLTSMLIGSKYRKLRRLDRSQNALPESVLLAEELILDAMTTEDIGVQVWQTKSAHRSMTPSNRCRILDLYFDLSHQSCDGKSPAKRVGPKPF